MLWVEIAGINRKIVEMDEILCQMDCQIDSDDFMSNRSKKWIENFKVYENNLNNLFIVENLEH